MSKIEINSIESAVRFVSACAFRHGELCERFGQRFGMATDAEHKSAETDKEAIAYLTGLVEQAGKPHEFEALPPKPAQRRAKPNRHVCGDGFDKEREYDSWMFALDLPGVDAGWISRTRSELPLTFNELGISCQTFRVWHERRKGERRKCQESMPHEMLGSPGHYSCRHCSRFWPIDSVHWLKQCPARDRRKGQRRGGMAPEPPMSEGDEPMVGFRKIAARSDDPVVSVAPTVDPATMAPAQQPSEDPENFEAL